MPRGVTVEEQIAARCVGCGYALRGLPARSHCPECGRAFDLNDPWTVSLPRRPNRLAQWVLRPPTPVGLALPVIAVVLVAWGSSVPGWTNGVLLGAAIVLASCYVTTASWRLALRHLRRRGYPNRDVTHVQRQWKRRLGIATVACALLVLLRPTMVARFWLSYPWLHRVAQRIEVQPFAQS